MDESEKMTALKKAYAEIILNTAKEAAARIMVSERRAQQVHHDLSYTKDEALRLLLRMKQTMDCKLKEAEMKSLNQQRRIEELEAQLQEAEDIVGNLREELSEAHMRLEEMERKQIFSRHNMMEKAVCEEEKAEPENDLSDTVFFSEAKGLNSAANGHIIAEKSLEQFGYAAVPDVPSIIVRSKKPELYRNGCTQRIRAYEGSLFNSHFSLSGESGDLKNEQTIKEGIEGERIFINPPIGADFTCSVGKKPVEVINVDKSNSKGQAFKLFRGKRKRAARYRRSNTSVLKCAPTIAKEPLSNHSNSQSCVPNSDDLLESFDDEGKGTKSIAPSTTPSNVSEMGALCEHVTAVQDDEIKVEVCTNAVAEDREVASSLVSIGEQNDSRDCLDDPKSIPELEMKSGS